MWPVAAPHQAVGPEGGEQQRRRRARPLEPDPIGTAQHDPDAAGAGFLEQKLEARVAQGAELAVEHAEMRDHDLVAAIEQHGQDLG